MFKRKEQVTHEYDVDEPLCEDMSFTTSEEYKMIRTKIDLILPNKLNDDSSEDATHNCHIIGITSALRGEGKSTMSINLAYSFAEANCTVCLIEADMRLPCIAKRLCLDEKPGLSNILIGKASIKDALQKYKSKKLHVITSGDVPPLPSELLESKNMSVLLKSLSEVFDYIIVDLPPVNVVTDTLALSKVKMLDGMLVVVRNKISNKNALRHAIKQFELTSTKVLGIIFNDASNPVGTSRYSSKYSDKYLSKYYRRREDT